MFHHLATYRKWKKMPEFIMDSGSKMQGFCRQAVFKKIEN